MSIGKVSNNKVSNNKVSNSKAARAIAAAVVLALGTATVQATETSKAPPTSKEQKVGMVSGTITGALIGGPIGAGVGFIVGTIAGVHAEKVRATAKKASSLEGQLASVQQELSAAQASLSAVAEKSGEDPMLTQLAQRLRADVLFRTASAELDVGASSKLGDLATVLANYPNLIIEIDGYADPRGKAGENLELSQQRASAVRAALIVGGAKPESIRVTAHGEQLSTAIKGDMDAYSWERRVSLSVLPAGQSQVAQIK